MQNLIGAFSQKSSWMLKRNKKIGMEFPDDKMQQHQSAFCREKTCQITEWEHFNFI